MRPAEPARPKLKDELVYYDMRSNGIHSQLVTPGRHIELDVLKPKFATKKFR